MAAGPPVLLKHLNSLSEQAVEIQMSKIGTFHKVGDEFTGQIITLSVQAQNVRIVPAPDRHARNAPSHYVHVGSAEIGAAWTAKTPDGRDYLSVKLDDPSFTGLICAELIRDADDETYVMIWSRG